MAQYPRSDPTQTYQYDLLYVLLIRYIVFWAVSWIQHLWGANIKFGILTQLVLARRFGKWLFASGSPRHVRWRHYSLFPRYIASIKVFWATHSSVTKSNWKLAHVSYSVKTPSSSSITYIFSCFLLK